MLLASGWWRPSSDTLWHAYRVVYELRPSMLKTYVVRLKLSLIPLQMQIVPSPAPTNRLPLAIIVSEVMPLLKAFLAGPIFWKILVFSLIATMSPVVVPQRKYSSLSVNWNNNKPQWTILFLKVNSLCLGHVGGYSCLLNVWFSNTIYLLSVLSEFMRM